MFFCFKNVLGLLAFLGQVEERVVELRGIWAIEDDAVTAVGPDSHRRALGVHVALKLLDTVFSLRLFALDDDLGRFFARVGVDDDVGGFGTDLGAKLHALLQIDLVSGVAVLIHQLVDPELPDDLFRRGLAARDVDLDYFVAG